MSDLSPEQEIEEQIESFRNSIATADKSGKRKWIFAKKPSGKFYDYRTYVSYVLLAFLIVTPFIKINGNPLFKFDILKREFFVFSYPFFTSDFKIFAIGLITTLVFIILFTAVYGRIFCGWVCPQTIFLEMVFRKIEYLIEGDRNKQMKLARQGWDEEKIRKKALKWTIYAVISFLIANIFLAWIIGIDALQNLIVEGPVKNASTFIALLAFTGVFYFIFTWFREQACVIVCPYGRLQGVLIDKKTIVVAYDYKRGEREKGRGKFKRNENREEAGKGDCIDCGQCVVVCPTGIDIRNGTQLECVNCTACIDACDEVMEKINLPPGLIRYASEDNIAKGQKFKFTTRMMAYSAVLVILMGVLSSFLFIRSDVNAKILRVAGTDYTQVDNQIMNQFEYTFQNKTKEVKQVRVNVVSHNGAKVNVITGNQTIEIAPGAQTQGKLNITIPQDQIDSYKERVKVEIVDQNNQVVDTYSMSFAAPFQ